VYVVTKEEAKNLSVELGFECVETSALTGVNVEEVFFSLAKHIMAKSPTERSKKKHHTPITIRSRYK